MKIISYFVNNELKTTNNTNSDLEIIEELIGNNIDITLEEVEEDDSTN